MNRQELKEMHRKYLDKDPTFDRDLWEKLMIFRSQILRDKAYDFLR